MPPDNEESDFGFVGYSLIGVDENTIGVSSAIRQSVPTGEDLPLRRYENSPTIQHAFEALVDHQARMEKTLETLRRRIDSREPLRPILEEPNAFKQKSPRHSLRRRKHHDTCR